MTQATCKRHIEKLDPELTILKGFNARVGRISLRILNDWPSEQTEYEQMVEEAFEEFYENFKKRG